MGRKLYRKNGAVDTMKDDGISLPFKVAPVINFEEIEPK
jgi:hypothetical protein